jgi:hypothetical protein
VHDTAQVGADRRQPASDRPRTCKRRLGREPRWEPGKRTGSENAARMRISHGGQSERAYRSGHLRMTYGCLRIRWLRTCRTEAGIEREDTGRRRTGSAGDLRRDRRDRRERHCLLPPRRCCCSGRSPRAASRSPVPPPCRPIQGKDAPEGAVNHDIPHRSRWLRQPRHNPHSQGFGAREDDGGDQDSLA